MEKTMPRVPEKDHSFSESYEELKAERDQLREAMAKLQKKNQFKP